MADIHESKTSGELAQEVEAQRNRVEATIGEIQERLSPGQLVDELINYTKTGAGSEFVSNLGRNITGNPLPVALMGISLVWLMAKQGSAGAAPADGQVGDRPAPSGIGSGSGYRPEHRYALVNGELRAIGRITGDDGRSYSEFADDAGKKYRALTGAAGERAGDFLDEAGASFRGFRNAAGERVSSIRDESGNMIDAASAWLSDLWNDTAHSLAEGRDSVQDNAAWAAGKISRQAKRSGATLLGTLQDQPLVGGALAFAVGAAIAASLPHTETEDETFGEAADALRAKAGDMAGDVYAEGKAQVAETYERAADKAGDIYREIKPDADNAARTAERSPAL